MEGLNSMNTLIKLTSLMKICQSLFEYDGTQHLSQFILRTLASQAVSFN